MNADFRVKGASPTNHSWYQSSRAVALSCGIKISAVRHVVLSQCTRVTDGRTDGRTDGQTDRITTPKTALAYARAVKIRHLVYIERQRGAYQAYNHEVNGLTHYVADRPLIEYKIQRSFVFLRVKCKMHIKFCVIFRRSRYP